MAAVGRVAMGGSRRLGHLHDLNLLSQQRRWVGKYSSTTPSSKPPTTRPTAPKRVNPHLEKGAKDSFFRILDELSKNPCPMEMEERLKALKESVSKTIPKIPASKESAERHFFTKLWEPGNLDIQAKPEAKSHTPSPTPKPIPVVARAQPGAVKPDTPPEVRPDVKYRWVDVDYGHGTSDWRPALSVKQSRTCVTIEMDVAGTREGEVLIKFNKVERAMNISAIRSIPELADGEKWIVNAFKPEFAGCLPFEASFTLPSWCQPKDVKAVSEDGILRVEVAIPVKEPIIEHKSGIWGDVPIKWVARESPFW